MKRCGVTANVPAKKNASIIEGGHSRLSGIFEDVKFQRYEFRKSTMLLSQYPLGFSSNISRIYQNKLKVAMKYIL